MEYSQSNKVKRFMQSEIRNMSLECDRVGGINLSQGICDLPLQDTLKNGVDEALKGGINHYTRYDGIDFLRKQIAGKAWSFNEIECDPGKNITVSCGATGALYCACYALLNPGDEVILFEPFYGYHEYTLISLDLVPVYARLKQPDWSIDFDALEQVVTPRTKAILINTPANPSGKVFTKLELELLGDFCEKNNLFVFTDEIYEYITYDGLKHISPASMSSLKDRTITISGYSKTFSITGWRIGYSIAEESITGLIGAVNDLIYVCAPAPLQYAVACAIKELGSDYYTELRRDFERKRDLICSVLTEIGCQPYIPQGAYYVLADVSRFPGVGSKEKATWLLNQTRIGSVPGEAFYHKCGGENLIRLCFAKSMDVLENACEMLYKIKGVL